MNLHEASELIRDTKRLLIFVPDRFHAKLAEKLCSRYKRSVVSTTWGVKLASVIRTFEARRNLDDGLVAIITASTGSVSGWRVDGDAVLWLGHVPDAVWLEQAGIRIGVASLLVHHCYPASGEIYNFDVVESVS